MKRFISFLYLKRATFCQLEKNENIPNIYNNDIIENITHVNKYFILCVTNLLYLPAVIEIIDIKSLNSNGSASNNRPSSIININFKYPKISNLNEKKIEN